MVVITRKKRIQNGGSSPPKTSFDTSFSNKTKSDFKKYISSSSNTNTDSFMKKKKKWYQSIGHSIYRTPKIIFYGVGATKNLVATSVKRGLGALYSGIRSKGFRRSDQEAKIKKKIENRLRETGGTEGIEGTKATEATNGTKATKGKTYNLPEGVQNPYQIASDIIGHRKTIEESRKNITKKGKTSDEISQLELKIREAENKIKSSDAEKQKLFAHAQTLENSNPEKQKLLKALGKINKYNSKYTRAISQDYDLGKVFKKSYKDTYHALKTDTLKTVASSFVPTILRRGYTTLKEGKRLKSLKTGLSGLGTKANRFFTIRKKSIGELSNFLTTDIKKLKKVQRQTGSVLENIKNMQAVIDSLKDEKGMPLTDSLSKARRDTLTEKILQQSNLLSALRTKGNRINDLIKLTEERLINKQGRKSAAKLTLLEKSKAKSNMFLGKFDSILAQTGENKLQYMTSARLLDRINKTGDLNILGSQITNAEVTGAVKELSNMRNKLLNKLKNSNLSQSEKNAINENIEIINKQGISLEQLKSKISSFENSKILQNRAETSRKFAKQTIKNTESLVKKPGTFFGVNVPNPLKYIPGISSNKTASGKFNKYAINSTLERLSSSELIKPAKLLNTQYSSDPVLSALYQSNPTDFNRIASDPSITGTPEEKKHKIKLL